MSSNPGSKSANSTPLLNGEVRSSSISSTFFKDSSTFFSEPKSDLDIVGALNNLNLDEEISNFDSVSHGHGSSNSAPNAGTPVLDGGYNGSLTPNPSNFGFANQFSQTPNTAWSNAYLIHNSAPPFAYNNYNGPLNEVANQDVKPFELPTTEDSSAHKKSNDNEINLHLPFTTPPPLPQQAFPSYPPNQKTDRTDNSSSESDLDSSLKSESTKATPNQSGFSGARSVSSPGSSIMGFINTEMGFPPQVAAAAIAGANPNIVPNYGDFNNLPQFGYSPWKNSLQPMAQQSMPIPQAPASSQPPIGNGANVPIHSQVNLNQNLRHHNYVDNRLNSIQNSQYNSNRFNRRSASGGFNEGSNTHRKMQNASNRRKGDDASKYANAKLEDFTGEIYSLCKDQHGCRFLQRQLDLGRDLENKQNSSNVISSDIAATMIFNEIYLKIVELMIDPFGNYLIQKLFENVSVDQRIILVKNASPEFIRIALDPHGTRALQKLVECITTEEEAKLIIDNLSPHIVSLSRDLNGNHVVQKCLQKLKPQDNQFIFDTASANCNEIATHRHGCCVLQRCLDHGSPTQKKQLSLKIAENATNLSLDPFGNYVVQYVLSRGDPTSIGMIMDHIKSNFIVLSLHKFGSNVIEKSLRINKLTDTLVSVLLSNSDHFGDLLNDSYGNYVLQTSLDVANPSDLNKLSQALQPLLPTIKNTPHGRRILSKVQSIFM